MRMLSGLPEPTEGASWLFGKPVDAHGMAVRRQAGFMSQAFALCTEPTVCQKLELHARLFGQF